MAEFVKRNGMARFRKISLEAWLKAFENGQKLTNKDIEELTKLYDNIRLPERGTIGSAGYDIFTPVPIGPIGPYQGQIIPSGINVEMDEGWVMLIFPKSRHWRYRLNLDYTVAVVDSDYGNNPDNQFFLHINNNLFPMPVINKITHTPEMNPEQVFVAEPGEAVMQAIFVQYGIAVELNPPTAKRTSGFGSTGNNDNEVDEKKSAPTTPASGIIIP